MSELETAIQTIRQSQAELRTLRAASQKDESAIQAVTENLGRQIQQAVAYANELQSPKKARDCVVQCRAMLEELRAIPEYSGRDFTDVESALADLDSALDVLLSNRDSGDPQGAIEFLSHQISEIQSQAEPPAQHILDHGGDPVTFLALFITIAHSEIMRARIFQLGKQMSKAEWDAWQSGQ
jgi:hypothetical protein